MGEFERRVAVELGRRVRRRRQFLDISQETLALRAGVYRTQISLWEHGERMPLTSTLVRLGRALEASPDQLLVGTRWEPSDSGAGARRGREWIFGHRTSVLHPKSPEMHERDQALAGAGRFGENLRRVFKREDLSQERLAKRASLHSTEIGLLEKGERVCRIDTLIRLAGRWRCRRRNCWRGSWVPGPEPDGTFSVNSSPIPPRPRPAKEEANE
ncbi:MAG: hypothetical protein BGO11_16115 [Solirubrobacterales bacterium 70-9]|nr:MAG: hypothetical protein BGO11_16115 [Solirubrobacterales bacterium 70-9]